MPSVWNSKRLRIGHLNPSVWKTGLIILSSGTTVAFGQTPVTDPTEPLRRYPVSFLVNRPSCNTDPVSLLRVDALHPQDELELKVDPDLAKDWTFVSATIASGQRIHVKSWNLWEKKYSSLPIDIGKLPKGDVVPLFFLVLNPHKEKKVADAITNALETSAGQIISQTASFDTIYQQQNRLLNFMSAYAALGPKQTADPGTFKNRIALINADLNMPYNPNAPQTQPGDLQHGLDAGMGILTTIRETPDNPGATAALAQQQLPSVVSDWVGLIGDLVHIFIRPPHQVKLSFIPASATEVDTQVLKTSTDSQDWMQLMTQRVLDTSGSSLPTLIFKPNFEAYPVAEKHSLEFQSNEILTEGTRVSIPLSPNSRDLFLHPYSWNWEFSEDKTNFKPIPGAQLVPGSGLSFPITSDFWKGANEKTILIRANVGFETMKPVEVKVAKVFRQQWTTQNADSLDFAAGDRSATVHLERTGTPQPFYKFASVALIDGAGHSIEASRVNYNNGVIATFDLANAAPGYAKLRLQQEDSSAADETATVFVEPRHPGVSLYCGRGDKELRVSGPEARWVKSIKVNSLFVTEADDSDPANRRLTLSGPFPDTVKSVDVTYRDPSTGLEWTRPLPVSVGLPRPKVQVTLMGSLPSTLSIGEGPDPSWAVATMPAGWFSTSQPIRVKLESLKPYVWSHDSKVELGLGSAGDVQSINLLQEGPTFALDEGSADAYVTLTLDLNLPQNPKRTSGMVWFRVTRTDLPSPWVLATHQDNPVRGVKVPMVSAVENNPAGELITLSNSDEVLGVKFPGQTTFVEPELVRAAPTGLISKVQAPAGCTEFDLKMRDGGDEFIHVKIVRPGK